MKTTEMSRERLSLGWLMPFWTVLWKSSVFFLLWAVLTSLTVVPFGAQLKALEEAAPLQARLYFDFTGAVMMLLATWVMVRWIDRRAFVTAGFAFNHLWRDVALGLVLGLIWLAVSLLSLWAPGWLALRPVNAVHWPALALSAAAMAFNVLTQQLLLCGYILQTIRSKSHPVVAVVVSAGLFSLFHAGAFSGGWAPPLNVFLAGALFGIAYSLTGNLWLPIAIHFAWNFLLGPGLGLTVSGQEIGNAWQAFRVQGPALFTGGDFGVEGGLIVTLTTLAMMAALLALRSVFRSNPPGPRPRQPFG
jgi:membrane protease YdiL (CAAX protease family)